MAGILVGAGRLLALQVGSAALSARKAAAAQAKVRELAIRDCAHLRDHGSLEPLDRAPVKPAMRYRSMVGRVVLGMGGSGVVVFLLALVSLVALSGMASDPLPMANRLAGSVLVAGLLGIVGFFVPGVGIGVGMWMAESKRRVDDAALEPLRSYWNLRESLREALAFGATTPQDAYFRLAAHAPPQHGQQPPLSFRPTS